MMVLNKLISKAVHDYTHTSFMYFLYILVLFALYELLKANAHTHFLVDFIQVHILYIIVGQAVFYFGKACFQTSLYIPKRNSKLLITSKQGQKKKKQEMHKNTLVNNSLNDVSCLNFDLCFLFFSNEVECNIPKRK